jgi:hypothetical protein
MCAPFFRLQFRVDFFGSDNFKLMLQISVRFEMKNCWLGWRKNVQARAGNTRKKSVAQAKIMQPERK